MAKPNRPTAKQRIIDANVAAAKQASIHAMGQMSLKDVFPHYKQALDSISVYAPNTKLYRMKGHTHAIVDVNAVMTQDQVGIFADAMRRQGLDVRYSTTHTPGIYNLKKKVGRRYVDAVKNPRFFVSKK